MSNSRNPLSAVAFFVVLGAVIYFTRHRDEGGSPQGGRSQRVEADSGTDHAQFGGYDCTSDCSGHEAGYKWAEDHGISVGDDCDAAGQRSNSPSFAEGCRAYVDGDSGPESDTDRDVRDDSDEEN